MQEHYFGKRTVEREASAGAIAAISQSPLLRPCAEPALDAGRHFPAVGDGHEVQVSDSKTGEDITVRVLAQLILEQAPEKLAALPAELLHQVIRANESLLREFVDKYFYRALTAFIESQREFDRYLRWR